MHPVVTRVERIGREEDDEREEEEGEGDPLPLLRRPAESMGPRFRLIPPDPTAHAAETTEPAYPFKRDRSR